MTLALRLGLARDRDLVVQELGATHARIHQMDVEPDRG
jgi:hypothetical protein